MTTDSKHAVFTKRLLRVIHLAYKEARLASASDIRAEHLLLGIMHEQGGMGAEILRRLGVYEDEVRREIVLPAPSSSLTTFIPHKSPLRRLLERFSPMPQSYVKALALSQEARQSLKRAQQEAERLHVNFVGTEHLLFGLAETDEGGLSRVFKQFHIDEKKVHDYIVRFYVHAGILA